MARWLAHNQRLRDGPGIDWKRQFKIRSNWASGTAKVHEVEVAHPPSPPVLARVHKGIIFTIDRLAGLRAWSLQNGARALLAQIQLDSSVEATCMAVETSGGETSVLLGYETGTFSTFIYQNDSGILEHRFSSGDSANGPLTAVALALPYVMTMSRSKSLTLYQVKQGDHQDNQTTNVSIIARLQSSAFFSPVSLAIRRAPGKVIATIAYAFNRIHSGWCVGLQEIRLTSNGSLLDSRLASTLETPLARRRPGQDMWEVSTRSASSMPLPLHPQLMSPPISLSYEHPFLISPLADNTIMSFLVTSNEEKLEISSGRRLWGHTSAVSGAQVNNRGKAVSISGRGDEMRVWELETVMTTTSQFRTSTKIQAVDALSGVVAAMKRRGSGLGLALREMKRELEITRRWVGFDEEQVVVLGERDQKQIMALYDFT